ncbi:MAG: hypothetical protein ACT4QC_13525 [Planctomycetaceae bacterium]
MADPEVARQPIAYWDWLSGVFWWDGVLPGVVLVAPHIVKRLLPNQPGLIELLAVVLPIAALLTRFVAGSRVIKANHCGTWFRGLQFTAFGVALVALMFFDAALMLSHNMPAAVGPFAAKGDQVVWAILAVVYLTNMVFAMYPGRAAIEPAS